MIYRKLLSRLRQRRKNTGSHSPKHWDVKIDDQKISQNAHKVLAGLQQAGFAAYLVGGGVRDLLVGKVPKDFDIVTDASPTQIRRVFRNSRIIGRRFQLVHVLYRQEIIEVSTFRAHTNGSKANNTFGTIEEDAWRRDFTVNALYYNPMDRIVIDYTQGMPDLDNCFIRMIGDPAQRFHEDPVRLLRAIRLAAKLQFDIHDQTENQVRVLSDLLEHVADSRLFDEVLKLFFTGYAQKTYRKLYDYGYCHILFPQVIDALDHPSLQGYSKLVESAMHETDRRYHNQQSLNPGFLLSVLLWPAVQKEMQEKNKEKFFMALRHAMDDVLKKQVQTLMIPNRLKAMMRAVWLLQYYLMKPRGQRVYRTLFHRYFRAAFDFLQLRVESGEPHQEILTWWGEFRNASSQQREKMLEQLAQDEKCQTK